ncbi:MAG: 3'(2'),5'-bisphosphate nucleotidase CysQ [Candidatus Neomarinimicrobiota bacterium]
MDELLQSAVLAAQAAGAILRKYYKQEYRISSKGPNNPVTSADFEADAFLKETLLRIRPDYGWLSEESADSAERLSKERVWIVDPLDGTQEFIAGRPEFMVSIGLTENDQPILGVLYNPITDELFSAQKGRGAFLNDRPIHGTKTAQIRAAHLIASRTEIAAGLWQSYLHYFKTVEPRGSVTYKLAQVAAGKADLHISLKPKNEWDVCGAHCLLNEAGAKMTERNGQPITYNRANPLIPGGVIAGNNQLIKQVYKIPFTDVWN